VFSRIAIINRGEPAVRLIHAVRELDTNGAPRPRTIALYTYAERHAMFVREADEAVLIGPGPGEPAPAVSPYLDYDVLADALTKTGADAAWVGWGFVAEHPGFATLCASLNVTFIGPSADVMRALGDKIGAKQLAEKAGVPVAAWSNGPVTDVADAHTHASRIGFPLMIKASAGGGGRGIRMVSQPDEIDDAFTRAQAEAERAFGDGTLFMERVVTDARHVEVQIIADAHGTVWAPGVRDCSLQRRNQKVIEESASTALTQAHVDTLKTAASQLAKEVGYVGAGTVEFLFQPEQDLFAFLEVNTRLQVEHPVTEMTTGIDLVALQLLVASGAPLPGPHPPDATGHAIEVRLNAEDPDRGFAPASGRIERFSIPVGPGLRIDTGVAEGDHIPPDFDSMIAKIIAYGATREHALRRMGRALAQTTVLIEGGTTNRAFLSTLIDHPAVIAGTFDTKWLDRLTADDALRSSAHSDVALVVAAIDAYDADARRERDLFLAAAARGRPHSAFEPVRTVDLRLDGAAYRLNVSLTGPDRYLIDHDGLRLLATVDALSPYERRVTIEQQRFRVVSLRQGADLLVEVDGVPHRISHDDAGLIRTPGPSVVVAVLVAPGDTVEAGATIAVIESMKMETRIAAPFSGVVSEVYASASTQLDGGSPLARIDAVTTDETSVNAATVRLDALARPDGPGPQDVTAAVNSLRRLVLGYDVPLDRVSHYLSTLSQAPLTDTLLVAELRVLRAFADLASLSRNRRLGDEEDATDTHSAREYLNAYLRTLDVAADNLPESFVAKLGQVLQQYNVTDLERTDALEQALFRVYLAQQRATAALPAILHLLERRLSTPRPNDDVLAEQLRDTLDRVIVATRVRYPAVGDLARRARYRCFDQPRIDAQRDAAYSKIRAGVKDLARLSGAARDELMDVLVASPEPMLGLMADHDLQGGQRAAMLELLTRRYYRSRTINQITTAHDAGRDVVVADVTDARGDGLVVAVSATADDLADAFVTIGRFAAVDGLGEGRCVADVYVTWPDAPTALDLLAAGLEADLSAVDLPATVRRVTISVTVTPGDADALERPAVEHLTFGRVGDGYEERRYLRGIHPLIASRLNLWRFEKFDLTRLPTQENGVYLFHGVAHDFPDDSRLFALAEVRDLTPNRDGDGNISALPELEEVLASCLGEIRRARAGFTPEQMPDWNRVILTIWPLVDAPVSELTPVIRRLAATTDGLGIEQVTVQARVAQPDGEPQTVTARMSRPPGQGFTFQITAPPTNPLEPIDELARKVIRARQRGSVYPYALIPLLTQSPDTPELPGTFVEYDLDDNGQLQPVDRPYAQNKAGVVVGVVTTPTLRYPEGMTRVAILGDPTRGLGSIGEGEGKRILAALDLAAELGAPVEWFAVSSGARIAMDSGTENMDWIARVLRRIVTFTQDGQEINVIVAGINVGGQPYWNAEATMLMHTKGILVMTPDSAMVLTGKQALDYSGGVSAEDNFGIGGYDRVMGPNGQAQYWAPDLEGACQVLFAHYAHSYRASGERFPRPAPTSDPADRDIRSYPHDLPAFGFTTVGEIFTEDTNPGRKKPFDIRTVLNAARDQDHLPLERWRDMADAEMTVVYDAHIGGTPVTLIGIESHPLARRGVLPADGPEQFTAGTLFPRASKKLARALNAASGVRPAVILANLSGFDGSPESLRELQLEYGAEIGRAVVNFAGPIVFVVISRYHGGAFVVFSKALNPTLEVAALTGSHASVIGGPPAAAVVFAAEVNRRTDEDPRVVTARDALRHATAGQIAERRTVLDMIRRDVRTEKLGEMAQEFDTVHSIERAQAVGSVDHIVEPANLRPYLIDALQRGMSRA
jgi:acetyl/propionyl-CoA carboxylase alpha subunit/acetyl-CoA carboxylase carboxyltransferase component